jgi:hypothetical protein
VFEGELRGSWFLRGVCLMAQKMPIDWLARFCCPRGATRIGRSMKVCDFLHWGVIVLPGLVLLFATWVWACCPSELMAAPRLGKKSATGMWTFCSLGWMRVVLLPTGVLVAHWQRGVLPLQLEVIALPGLASLFATRVWACCPSGLMVALRLGWKSATGVWTLVHWGG